MSCGIGLLCLITGLSCLLSRPPEKWFATRSVASTTGAALICRVCDPDCCNGSGSIELKLAAPDDANSGYVVGIGTNLLCPDQDNVVNGCGFVVVLEVTNDPKMFGGEITYLSEYIDLSQDCGRDDDPGNFTPQFGWKDTTLDGTEFKANATLYAADCQGNIDIFLDYRSVILSYIVMSYI